MPELSGQLLQVVAPVDEEYFPVLHAKQTEDEDAPVPVVVLYVPALHWVQLLEAAAAYEPAVHETQAVDEVEPVFGLYFPAAHEVHVEVEQYLPAAQDGVHAKRCSFAPLLVGE